MTAENVHDLITIALIVGALVVGYLCFNWRS